MAKTWPPQWVTLYDIRADLFQGDVVHWLFMNLTYFGKLTTARSKRHPPEGVLSWK